MTVNMLKIRKSLSFLTAVAVLVGLAMSFFVGPAIAANYATNITGTIPNNVTNGFDVALCQVACVDNNAHTFGTNTSSGHVFTGAVDPGASTFGIFGPDNGTYKFAIDFPIYGYLQLQSDGTYSVVTNFNSGSNFTVNGSANLGTLNIPAAQTGQIDPCANHACDTTPPLQAGGGSGSSSQQQSGMVSYMGGVITGNSITLHFVGQNVNPGTTVDLSYIGCGEKTLGSDTITKSGNYDFYKTLNLPALGRTATYSEVITEPGYITVNKKDSFNFGSHAPACPTTGGSSSSSGHTVPSNFIKKWSVAKGVFKVKHRVHTPRTVLTSAGKRAHCTVTYKWSIGGKVKSSKKKFYLKKSYRGKLVSVRITVKCKGYTSRTKTIAKAVR